jgi:hypothetical protein
MSERYTSTNIENPLDFFIKKYNKKIEEKLEILPRITDHALFLGTTMSGKSYLIKAMLYHDYENVFDRIVIVCPTYDKENYKDMFFIKEKDVIRDLNEDIIMKLLNDSKDTFISRSGNFFTLIVFDDCVDEMKTYRRFNKFISTARHYGITVWCSTQYAFNIAKPVRQQFVAQFLWTNVTPENLDSIKGILPISKKHAEECIHIVREINREKGNSYTPLYLNKRFPGKAYYGLDQEIIIDDE